MELEHTFTVPVPPHEAFAVLRDVERIGPCMPGATIESVDGDNFTGSVKVKIGPIKVTYTGSAKYAQVDEEALTATIEAKGKEKRGQGTANATVTSRLTDVSDGHEVHVVTDLAVTGRPAQFGRGVMEEVGEKLINQFADCMARKLGGEEEAVEGPEPAATAAGPTTAGPATGGAAADGAVSTTGRDTPTNGSSAARPAPRTEAEAIDLLDIAGAPVARRAAPALGAVLLVVFLWWLVRGRRD